MEGVASGLSNNCHWILRYYAINTHNVHVSTHLKILPAITSNIMIKVFAQDQRVRVPWLYILEVLMSTKFSSRCSFDSLQRPGVISLARSQDEDISHLTPTHTGDFHQLFSIGKLRGMNKSGLGKVSLKHDSRWFHILSCKLYFYHSEWTCQRLPWFTGINAAAAAGCNLIFLPFNSGTLQSFFPSVNSFQTQKDQKYYLNSEYKMQLTSQIKDYNTIKQKFSCKKSSQLSLQHVKSSYKIPLVLTPLTFKTQLGENIFRIHLDCR